MKCPKCGKLFEKKKSLTNHYRWCSDKKQHNKFRNSYSDKMSEFMKKNNPAKRPEVRKTISNTLKRKYKEGVIVSFFKNNDKIKKMSSKRMKGHNPNADGRVTRGKHIWKNKKHPMLGIHRWNSDNPNWQGGLKALPYGPEWNNKLKQEIKERDDYTCQLCGDKILKQTKRKFLSVHHIDYNKKNNSKNNLISLCNFCNSSVNKDREDWTIFFNTKLKGDSNSLS